MFEPLAIGNCTLKADVREDSRIRMTIGASGANEARGRKKPKTNAPSAMTERMYQRARGGSSRSKVGTSIYLDSFTFCGGTPGPRGWLPRPESFEACFTGGTDASCRRNV